MASGYGLGRKPALRIVPPATEMLIKIRGVGPVQADPRSTILALWSPSASALPLRNRERAFFLQKSSTRRNARAENSRLRNAEDHRHKCREQGAWPRASIEINAWAASARAAPGFFLGTPLGKSDSGRPRNRTRTPTTTPRPAKFTMLVFGRAKIGCTLSVLELLCRKSLSESTENNAKTSPKNRTASH